MNKPPLKKKIHNDEAIRSPNGASLNLIYKNEEFEKDKPQRANAPSTSYYQHFSLTSFPHCRKEIAHIQHYHIILNSINKQSMITS